MKKSGLLRVLCILLTSVVLICLPESSLAAGGHGGGGGGFHGGGFGGYHGGWGGAGWHGGWGGYGWRGWGYPGWGVGVGFGWGSCWAGYPYAYAYPYPYPYYYPYDPYYPYYGSNAYRPADPYDGGNRDPRDNSPQQDSSYPGPAGSPSVTEGIPTRTFANHKTAGDAGSAQYWLSNYQQHMVQRQEVRNVIEALLAMPPEARRRQIESGQYRNFSPEEQEFLNQVAQVSPRGEQNNTDGTKPEGFRLASQ